MCRYALVVVSAHVLALFSTAYSATFSMGSVQMRAPSARFYRTSGTSSSFDAVAAFQPEVFTLRRSWGAVHRDNTKMAFRIYADGRKVADTGLFTPKSAPIPLHAELGDAKVVIVECVDGGYWLGTPALLGELRDVRVGGTSEVMFEEDVSGEMAPQLPILTPPEDSAPRINGPALWGVRPGRRILFRLPVSGRRPFKVAVSGLPKGVSFNAETLQMDGLLAHEGEYLIHFEVTNDFGISRRDLRLVVGKKIALTPPMGWTSWNALRLGITEANIRLTADVMASKGLVDYGWSYVNLDDGWQRRPKTDDYALYPPTRDEDGRILPNRNFPDMKSLVDHIHALGLKAGIYSTPGPLTCAGYEGSYGHEADDVRSWDEWGFDYIKYDLCSYDKILKEETKGREILISDRAKPYVKLNEALQKTSRDFVYSFSGGSGRWAEEAGSNLGRTWFDLKDSWGAMLNSVQSAVTALHLSHPGYWCDPDMLLVGVVNTGLIGPHPTFLTPNEQFSMMTLWPLMNAPLLLGCQMDGIDDFTLSLLKNPEVLDIDQDVAYPPAKCICFDEEEIVMVKRLSDDSHAVGVINLLPYKRMVTVDFQRCGLSRTVRLRDLWRRVNLGCFHSRYEVELPPHAPIFLRCFCQDGASGVRN